MNLIPLHDGRPGLRTLLQVETRQPSLSEISNIKSQIPTPDPSEAGPVAPKRSEGGLASEIGANSCNSCLDFISSTATLDRYHEIIDPAGWRLDSYRRNPVFQNAHNYGDILFTLGKALITEVRGGTSSASPHLFQRIQFATDVNPIARIAYGLYKGSFLNAVSVGFIPLRWEDLHPGGTSSASPQSQPRRKYLEQELLEVSAVAIPANPDALALGIKTGAITKADLTDTLDLLRSLTIDYGPWRPPHNRALSTPSTPSQDLLTFARELRRILRRS